MTVLFCFESSEEMPKYYCDYCDTFLTHDSPSVRKTHNGGRKHKENVRMFYQRWMEEQAQKLVDATARAFTGGNTAKPGMGKPMGAPMGAPMMPAMMGRPPMMGAPVAGMRGPMPPFGFPGAMPPFGVPMGMPPIRGPPAPFRSGPTQ
ncbi:U1 zinc finger [Ancylostoma caninum]|uniref:U1 small nuclear ribonucleoprotein C n=1 Tax=Ancylostoma caninum TaxID=29170 RepID=A0A368GPL4_ANCCA|nr:U1 zinc finger [Ancylostoma caninum]